MLEIPASNLNKDVLLDDVIEIEHRMSSVAAECFDIGGLLQAYADKCVLDVGRLVARDGVGFEIGKSLRSVPLNAGQKYEYVSGYTWNRLRPLLTRTKEACRSVLQEYWAVVRKHEHLMRLHGKTYSCGMKDLLGKTHVEKIVDCDDPSRAVLFYDCRRDFEYLVQEVEFGGAVYSPGPVKEQRMALPDGHEEVVMHYAGKGRASVYKLHNYSVKVGPERVLECVGRRLLERFKKENPESVEKARERLWVEAGVERAVEKIRERL